MSADFSSQPIEALVGELLRQRGLTLATAESCTGGLIGHLLTNVPGSSDYYLGGVVSYANEAKMRLLGVARETLDRHGAVSEESARQMARGVRRLLAADVGLSVTGIAGPGGGSPQKPVGLTWVGLCTPEGEEVRCFQWDHDRLGNKTASAQAALKMLCEYLQK